MTISVNIFQIVRTQNGKDKKKGTGIYRVGGGSKERLRIYGDAEAICQHLNTFQFDSTQKADREQAREIAKGIMQTRRALRQAGKA